MPQRIKEIALLRQEIEILMEERQLLLKVAGSAAALIAGLDSALLTDGTVVAADVLSTSINQLPQETLHDALSSVKAKIDLDDVITSS